MKLKRSTGKNPFAGWRLLLCLLCLTGSCKRRAGEGNTEENSSKLSSAETSDHTPSAFRVEAQDENQASVPKDLSPENVSESPLRASLENHKLSAIEPSVQGEENDFDLIKNPAGISKAFSESESVDDKNKIIEKFMAQHDSDITKHLLEFIQDVPESADRNSYMQSFANAANTYHAPGVIRFALSTPNAEMIDFAEGVFGSVTGSAALDNLREIYHEPQLSAGQRNHLLQLLSSVSNPETVPALKRIVEMESGELEQAAVTALRSMNSDTSVYVLAEILDHAEIEIPVEMPPHVSFFPIGSFEAQKAVLELASVLAGSNEPFLSTAGYELSYSLALIDTDSLFEYLDRNPSDTDHAKRNLLEEELSQTPE